MLAYCGRPPAASSGDRFPYIVPGYARETIAPRLIRFGYSLRVALATASITQTGSQPGKRRITATL